MNTVLLQIIEYDRAFRTGSTIDHKILARGKNMISIGIPSTLFEDSPNTGFSLPAGYYKLALQYDLDVRMGAVPSATDIFNLNNHFTLTVSNPKYLDMNNSGVMVCFNGIVSVYLPSIEFFVQDTDTIYFSATPTFSKGSVPQSGTFIAQKMALSIIKIADKI